MGQFDGKVGPLEQRIALKLRNVLSGVKDARGAMLAISSTTIIVKALDELGMHHKCASVRAIAASI